MKLVFTFLLCSLSSLLCAEPLRLAVSANFVDSAETLAAQFSQQYGVEVTISSGSTGALYAQIRQGAPFDVFLAADVKRPLALEQAQLIVPGSRLTYAIGLLAYWDSKESFTRDTLDEQQLVAVLAKRERLSIANPKTAPYGEAARSLLQRLELWDSLAKFTIRGNSVLHAFQFIDTGNIGRGLVAYHLVKDKAGSVLIPQHLYQPIEQQMIILKSSKWVETASQFQSFLLSSNTQINLSNKGYMAIDSAQVEP